MGDDRARIAAGCDACGGTGYAGRLPAAALDAVPDAAGFGPDRADDGARLFDAAVAAVRAGATDPAEVRRTFGFGRRRRPDASAGDAAPAARAS